MAIIIDKALGRELNHTHAVPVSATAPSNPKEGYLYYDTDDSTLYIYVSSAWVAIGSAGVDGTFDFMDGNDLSFMDGNPAAFMSG